MPEPTTAARRPSRPGAGAIGAAVTVASVVALAGSGGSSPAASRGRHPFHCQYHASAGMVGVFVVS